jgi:hypothetical protein
MFAYAFELQRRKSCMRCVAGLHKLRLYKAKSIDRAVRRINADYADAEAATPVVTRIMLQPKESSAFGSTWRVQIARWHQRWLLCAALLIVGGCEGTPVVQTSARRFVELPEPMLFIPTSDTILTSFVQSALLVDDQIVLLQPQDARIIALDAVTGRPTWSAGRRGAGPGEFFQPQSMFPRVGGGFGVVDSRQGRITLFSAAGAVVGEVTGDMFGREVQNVCDTGDYGLLVLQLPYFGVVRANVQGKIVKRDSLVWPDTTMNGSTYFRQAFWANSRGGRCVTFAMMGNYFAEYDAVALLPRAFRPYVVPLKFPRPVGERNGWPTYNARVSSAGAGAISDKDFFVLYGGQREPYDQIIDVYTLADGAYRYSMKLPRKTYFIDVLGGRLLTIETTEEGQSISLFPLPSAPPGS